MLKPKWSRRAVPVVFSVMVLGAFACAVPTEACGCSFALNHEIPVLGVVARANSAPASQVVIRAHAYAGACPTTDSGYVDLTQAFGVSDDQGRFRFSVRTMDAVLNACVRVWIYRDAALGAPLTQTNDYPGRRLQRGDRGIPVDSLVLAVTVP